MKIKEFIVAEIIKALTGAYGIESHFCDWSNPKHWVYPTTPAEVQSWVIKRIKEFANEGEDKSIKGGSWFRNACVKRIRHRK